MPAIGALRGEPIDIHSQNYTQIIDRQWNKRRRMSISALKTIHNIIESSLKSEPLIERDEELTKIVSEVV